jgi:Ca2+-binding RTX toxin-like protein
MRRIATVAATAAALLLVPAVAAADETVSVGDGVLSYVSGGGTADTVTLSAGPGTDTLVSETTSPSGSVGTACTVYAPSTARCAGATSAVLETLDGDDTVTLIATIPATVRGGDGADTITGGPAIDTIDAGEGADVVDVRGGGADTVDCGPGFDRVYKDRADRVANCESIG